MAKSIKRNYFYNIFLNISKVIFPLITAPYVSRVLEPDGVGLFNFANTYANWFALFAALGIPYYGIREIAKIKEDVKEQSKFVSEILSLSIISTLICSIVLFSTLFFVPQLNENYIVFLAASIVLYFTPLRTEWYFSGKEEFGYITLRSLVIKTISVILLFVVVRSKDDLISYVILYAVSIIANDIWNFIKIYRLGIRPYLTLSIGKHVKPLMILFSSNIAIYVYTALDTIMLGFLSDYSEVGYYNCATHISKALIPIVTSLAAVALPRVAQYREAGMMDEINNLLNRSFSIVVFLSIPIAMGVISVAPVFVPLFFGDQFFGTIIPLQIIILTVVVVGLNNLTGIQVLLGFGMDKYFLYSILAGTVSSFSVNLILIPYYGAVGAAISSVMAETVVLLVMLYFIYKNTNVRFKGLGNLFVALLFSLFFPLISYVIFHLSSGWISVFIVITLCSLIYIVAQYFVRNPAEKEFIQMLSAKLRERNSHY